VRIASLKEVLSIELGYGDILAVVVDMVLVGVKCFWRVVVFGRLSDN